MLGKSEKIWMAGKLVPWDDAETRLGPHMEECDIRPIV